MYMNRVVEKLQAQYAHRVAMPEIAYWRQDGLGEGFRGNASINGLARDTLGRCIYVGPLGASAEIPPSSICREGLRTCRQVVRYARGFRAVEAEAWQPPKVKLRLNTEEVQRDVLKARREIVKNGAQLFQERFEELGEVRKQMDIIDIERMRARYREKIDLYSRPAVTSEERGTLQTKVDSTLDWEVWNGMPPHQQWGAMANTSLISPKPTGVTEEGSKSDDGDNGREVSRRVRS